MTTKSEFQEGPDKENIFLSPEENTILGQMATAEPPHSQRAQALLAVDKGATQAEAGHLAGLTAGQVRYWLAKFRRDRTDIFPVELRKQPPQIETDSVQSPAKQTASPDVLDLGQPKEKEDVQQELVDTEEVVGPVDSELAKQADMPKAKKKSMKTEKSEETKKPKKDKKATKRKKPEKKTKKSVETKKSKKDKKAVKGKKSQKKTKKSVKAKKPKKDKKAVKGKKSQKKTKNISQKKKDKKGKSEKKRENR